MGRLAFGPRPSYLEGMDIAIIVFPGTNREKDMAMAFSDVTGHRPRYVWHKETRLGRPDLVVLPGGFSYGDYLRCGAMAAHSPVMREVVALAARGTRVLGVCNGFQILVETGLVPGALLRNRDLKFLCRQVYLRAENAATAFTGGLQPGEVLRVPIAHGEGNYFAAPETICQLEDRGQIAFRYCDSQGRTGSLANPNGSAADIAGVFNEGKTVLGMMPHPEDAVQAHHDNRSGRKLFEGLIAALAA